MQSTLHGSAAWPNGSIITVYVGIGIAAAILFFHILTGKPNTTAAFVRRNPMVLLPPLLAMNLIWLLGEVPWLSAATPKYSYSNLSGQLSAMLVIKLIASPLAIWVSVYCTHAAADNFQPAPTLKQAWRFVVASLLATMAMFALLLAIRPVFSNAPIFALLLMGLAWLIFDLLSCTWYAAMMNDEPRLWFAFWQSAMFAIQRWKPLLVRVAFQLLFCGFLVIYSVATNRYQSPPLPHPPTLPINGGMVGSSSISSGFGGFGSSQNTGWSIQLLWVLSADNGNKWLDKTAEECGETPWPICSYIVSTLTVLVGTYFIVGYSLIFLRRPIAAKPDRRIGFEVLPLRVAPD